LPPVRIREREANAQPPFFFKKCAAAIMPPRRSLIGTGRKGKRGAGVIDLVKSAASAIGRELKQKKVLSNLLRKIPKVGAPAGAIAAELGYGKRKAAGRPRRNTEMIGGAAVGQFGSKVNSKFFPAPYAPASGSGRKGKGIIGDLLGTAAGFIPGVGRFASPIVHSLAGHLGLGKKGRGKAPPASTRGGVSTYGSVMF